MYSPIPSLSPAGRKVGRVEVYIIIHSAKTVIRGGFYQHSLDLSSPNSNSQHKFKGTVSREKYELLSGIPLVTNNDTHNGF